MQHRHARQGKAAAAWSRGLRTRHAALGSGLGPRRQGQGLPCGHGVAPHQGTRAATHHVPACRNAAWRAGRPACKDPLCPQRGMLTCSQVHQAGCHTSHTGRAPTDTHAQPGTPATCSLARSAVTASRPRAARLVPNKRREISAPQAAPVPRSPAGNAAAPGRPGGRLRQDRAPRSSALQCNAARAPTLLPQGQRPSAEGVPARGGAEPTRRCFPPTLVRARRAAGPRSSATTSRSKSRRGLWLSPRQGSHCPWPGFRHVEFGSWTAAVRADGPQTNHTCTALPASAVTPVCLRVCTCVHAGETGASGPTQPSPSWPGPCLFCSHCSYLKPGQGWAWGWRSSSHWGSPATGPGGDLCLGSAGAEILRPRRRILVPAELSVRCHQGQGQGCASCRGLRVSPRAPSPRAAPC